jgi:hypothetical protein
MPLLDRHAGHQYLSIAGIPAIFEFCEELRVLHLGEDALLQHLLILIKRRTTRSQ